MIDAFPLHWPPHWKRTKHQERSIFSTTFGRARDQLLYEIRLLGGTRTIISTDIPIRKDGIPYAMRREPEDKGVAVYFNLFGKQQCFPCDKWDKIVDNLHAIELCIAALRGLERWGAKEMVQASFTGFQALPDYSSSSDKINYFEGCNTPEEERTRYRELAKTLHPDKGGTDEEFAELQKQFQEANQ